MIKIYFKSSLESGYLTVAKYARAKIEEKLIHSGKKIVKVEQY